jgi:hypothetical protein
MFGQAAGVNQFDPRTYRFPVFGFDVADLGRDAVFYAGTWSSLAGGARLILPPPLAGLRDSSCGGTEGTGDGGGSISCCRWWPSSLGDRPTGTQPCLRCVRSSFVLRKQLVREVIAHFGSRRRCPVGGTSQRVGVASGQGGFWGAPA